MGADLYIEEIFEATFQKYQPAFLAAARKHDQSPQGSKEAKNAQAEAGKYEELMFSVGYFRDNYNVSSVLWRLGLSWWEDVKPLCDKNGHLKGDALINFRQRVQTTQLALPTKVELKKGGAHVTGFGKHSLAGWHNHFRQKHSELLAFLDQAIVRQLPIQCSL